MTYYQITNNSEEPNNDKQINFNVTFDKDKIHNLFYERGILYSEISDKELYILPILIKKDEILFLIIIFFTITGIRFTKMI